MTPCLLPQKVDSHTDLLDPPPRAPLLWRTVRGTLICQTKVKYGLMVSRNWVLVLLF